MTGYAAVLGAGRLVTPAMADTGSDVVAARAFEMVDAQGRRQMLMATSNEGTPSIWFFDQNGKARLNLGLYADGNAAVVLNDGDERAVEIFRTVGARNVPVLVMKSQGQDRMILGLQEATQDPYFVYWDEKNQKRALFGSD
jgi:hypothetical protein